MSLGFLSPAPAGAPPARGPLADPAAAAGAHFEARHGWEVAASFGDPDGEAAACAEAVGFADLSHLTKLELQGAPEAIAMALGAPAPPEDSPSGSALGLARRDGDVWRCPLTPAKALVLAEPEHAGAARSGLDAVRVCDLTGAWGALAIAGPLARELFARFCAVDVRASALPIRGLRPGSVARTPGYVLREGADRFLMVFGAAYGAYVWDVVTDAAAQLGGRAVGVDALPPPAGGARAPAPRPRAAASGEEAARA